ncbi:MAG: cytochrome b/b6 domain-containing protein [Coriobacteriia bacterium]|nr:cytochrome b/b6 domain-containing protein [Coriobacteriia bacterium]MBN2821930.1 cytochrome b/b6 domain-containing protein [Coriobacteriia bacterium]
MRYIQRQSAFARGLHWIHTIACMSLFVTGLMLFIPAVASAVGLGAMQGARTVHRVMAVIFIAAPLLAVVVNPKGFKHFLKNMFYKWDAGDKEFMAKFFPYLFTGAKQHMPEQKELKSGQALSDWMLFAFAIAISISGVFLWLSASGVAINGTLTLWMLVAHDVAFVLLGLMMFVHIYLGAGVFQPYRGSVRLMFGDGKVSESDALYHWGTWAKEELAKGDKVSVE